MRGFEQTLIRGHVGRDVERRVTGSGTEVAKTAVAVNRSWRDRTTGEAKTAVQWYPVTFIGRNAEIANQYLRKGSHVMIEGAMRSQSREIDGQKRTFWELKVDSFDMLDAKPTAPSNSMPLAAGSDLVSDDTGEDDIPF